MPVVQSTARHPLPPTCLVFARQLRSGSAPGDLKSLDDGPRRYAPAAVDEQGDGGRGSAHSGRLELTWTNKDKRLLSYEDGSYVWVTPSDHRVAEVRLLDDAGTVGAVNAERRRAHDNLLIHGDALNALTSLAELPEFASQYVGKVKLAYLDPPFNTPSRSCTTTTRSSTPSG